MKHAIVVLPLVGGLLGCAGWDPWGASSWTSPAPGVSYGGLSYEKSYSLPAVLDVDRRSKLLSLAEAIAIALERRPETRAAWLASRAAAGRVGEERASYLPEMDAFAEGLRENTPEERDKGVNPHDDVRTGFAVRYLLFDGGLRYASNRRAEAELLEANWTHEQKILDVAVAVELAYHARLSADALVRVAEDTLRSRQYHLDLARARLENGTAAKFDVLKAETERDEAELLRVRARSEVQVAQGRLARAMGLRVGEPFEILPLPDPDPDEELAEFLMALREGLKRRPELRAALARVEARRADVRAVRAEFLPVVHVSGTYGWADTKFLPDREDWAMGIGVTLPLFGGFRRQYRVHAAEARLRADQAEEERIARDIELEIWDSRARMVEAAEAVRAARTLVASAEESARVAEGRYRAGVGSIIEMADAVSARTAARMRHVQTSVNWFSARARFQRSLGRVTTPAVGREEE